MRQIAGGATPQVPSWLVGLARDASRPPRPWHGGVVGTTLVEQTQVMEPTAPAVEADAGDATRGDVPLAEEESARGFSGTPN